MEKTTNVSTGYLCHCLRITVERYEEILGEEGAPTFARLKEKHGVGSLCSSCEYEAKGILQEYVLLNPHKAVVRDVPSGPRGLRAELGYAWGRLKTLLGVGVKRKKKSRDLSKPAGPKVYHTGIYFMRKAGLESHLVVSNLPFPEHERNINGPRATFRATLYGEEGERLAVSQSMAVQDGQTLELSPADLFPELSGDFVGGLYVDYETLEQTGSLRPYGVLVSTAGEARARCHYHDKFGLFAEPGFVQNSSPFEPGQDCWMALANCQPRAYETDMFLKRGGQKEKTRLVVPAMGARWMRLADLFPAAKTAAPERTPALFWLENPQHVMVYFFWMNETAKTWMGQHH
jgi:bacterioferritin-associated ferredoxin